MNLVMIFAECHAVCWVQFCCAVVCKGDKLWSCVQCTCGAPAPTYNAFPFQRSAVEWSAQPLLQLCLKVQLLSFQWQSSHKVLTQHTFKRISWPRIVRLYDRQRRRGQWYCLFIDILFTALLLSTEWGLTLVGFLSRQMEASKDRTGINQRELIFFSK